MTRPAPPRPPRGPFVLLGLMTLATVGGPLLIGFVLRGGARPKWPPDRPVEWAAVWGVCSAVALLMGACLAIAWANRRASAPPRTGHPAPSRSPASAEVES